MEARQERGQQIAAAGRLRQKGALWIVPSQRGAGTYVVDPATPECTCPDFKERQLACKHVFAVEYTVKRVTTPFGSIVTETVRVTYPQQWPAYNAAQTNEKRHVAELLRDLCSAIDEPPAKRGRPPLSPRTAVFAAVMKVYSGMSTRRAMSDLTDLAAKGFIPGAPHFNSVIKAMDDPALGSILSAMIHESAGPLAAVETDFAVDSSGFASHVYHRWYDEKYGRERSQVEWLKAHVMVGVRTNIVTSVEVTGGTAADSRFLEPLLHASLQRFNVERLSADKAYSSRALLQRIHDAGAVPLIPFKYNASPTVSPLSPRSREGADIWEKMYLFYRYHREEFLSKYHQRSNVEATFHMIKSKFGPSVRSKTPTARVNEVLCKVLCHNLCCLVQSMYELGIEPEFWKAA